MLSISTTGHLHHHHSSFAFRPKNSIPFRTPKTQFSLHHASLPDPTKDEGENVGESLSPSAAAALAAAIRRASPASPVKFTQRVEKQGKAGLIFPSPDFQRICIEQLELFRMVVHRDAILSVFVRPAGSYVMDRLELRRVTFYPGIAVSENTDCVILVGNFAVSAGLRSAEAALSKQQVEFLSEYGSVILPMVKHPFVVGFLVAELPNLETEIHENAQSGEQYLPFCSMKVGSPELPPCSDKKLWEIQTFKEDPNRNYAQLTHDQKSRAMMISRSLAMAYVMDQKAMLLQQSSWQNNVRMSHLVEQIHSSISSIRALSKMLSVHVKKSEISLDIIEDILMQGDHMKDTLQQLQDAVYLTKANIVQYNEDTLRRAHDSTNNHQESFKFFQSDYHLREPGENVTQKNGRKAELYEEILLDLDPCGSIIGVPISSALNQDQREWTLIAGAAVKEPKLDLEDKVNFKGRALMQAKGSPASTVSISELLQGSEKEREQ